MELATQDQADREHFFDDPDNVTRRDRFRRRAVRKLLGQNKVRSAIDYFNAALIFQHGLTTRDYEYAQRLARMSAERGGGEQSRWLYAVATDRLLLARGRKQKFGTQFSILTTVDQKTKIPHRVMRMLPYDRRTSDATRHKHGLSNLDKLLKMDGSPPPKMQKRIVAKPNTLAYKTLTA